METKLTEMQQLRMALAHSLNFDVDKAKKVFNFVIGDQPAPDTPILHACADGVYYVVKGGYLTETVDPQSVADQVIGVAVKMGDKFATVALHDAADGEEIALTEEGESGSPGFFHSDFYDAITDWNGEANTKDYGEALNPEIGLKEGQYIPSLAQLHLILLNIKEVNKALEAVGGSPMRKVWYWSSTEYSSHYSWNVLFYSGSVYYNKSCAYVVRPAVALSV